MFLENESKLCECRVNLFFWRISLRQPVCSYTPITIIRMISWARNVGTWDFYISIAMFCDYCFLSIFDASINFMRCFPIMIKKKEKKNKKQKRWIHGSILKRCSCSQYFQLLKNDVGGRFFRNKKQKMNDWKRWHRVHSQTLKRVPTYIICRVGTESC